jgi:hypothetical protein
MSELPKPIPALEWWEAPKGDLSEIVKSLRLWDYVLREINKLSQEEKEELEISLAKILKEHINWEIWETDKNQKISSTFAWKYNINISQWVVTSGEETMNLKNEKISVNDAMFIRLDNNLRFVKALDDRIVSDELAKAKATPLPQDAKLAIAKAANIPVEKLDESIQKWDNPQLGNLIDTYYLSQEDTIKAISTKLPKDKESEMKATQAFWELRASAREFWIPYSERADNVKALISNKSDATQAKVVETVWTLTKWAPDTMITRTGDKLTFNNPNDKNSQYEIDIGQNPPKLKKTIGGLSISRDIPDTQTQTKQTELINTQNKARTSLVESTKNYTSLESMSRENGTDMEKYLWELYGTNNTLKSARDIAKKKYSEAKTPEESLKALQELKASNADVGIASKKPEFLTLERSTKPEVMKLEELLKNEDSQIDSIIQQIENYIKIDKQVKSSPRSNQMNLKDWEWDVDKSLWLLNNVWYAILGQELTEKLIDAINLKKWWKNTNNEIDLNKNPKLESFQEDEIVTWLARLTRVNNTMPSWNSVEPTDRIIAERQLTSWNSGKNALISVKNIYETNERTRGYWNTSESLGNWLYKDARNQEEPQENQKPNSAINLTQNTGTALA